MLNSVSFRGVQGVRIAVGQNADEAFRGERVQEGSVTCGIGAVAGLEEHHRDRGVDLVGSGTKAVKVVSCILG